MSLRFVGPVPVPPPQKGGLVVLVTGASRGLGYELVRQYAVASPANVIFAGVRSVKKADALTAFAASHPAVHVVELDVASEDSIRASVASVQRKADHVDVLINNAGIYGSAEGTDPTTATVEQFREVFATNVTGVLVTTQAYLPLLRRSTAEGGAKVFNVSSGIGSNQLANVFGKPTTSYGVSKAALNYLTQCFRYAVPEVAFLAISPGWVGTDMGNAAAEAPTKTEDSVQAIRYYIATKTVKNSGEFLDIMTGELIPF